MRRRVVGMDEALLATFAAEVRDQVIPADEGSVWALFLGRDDRPLLASKVDDAREPHTLAYLLANVGAHAVVAAIARRDGVALEADRQLHRALRVLMAGERTRLLDAIVVGAYSWVSLSTAAPPAEGVA
jgi:hypothetical protein